MLRVRCFPAVHGKAILTPQSMWSTLRYIRDAKPTAGCLENVMGLKTAGENEKAPVSIVEEELHQGGFETLIVELNLNTFTTMVRPRIPNHAYHMRDIRSGERVRRPTVSIWQLCL